MKKIGFVGLGDMGMGMAKNLLKAGYQVRGYDLQPQRLQNFVNAGGIAAASTADTAAGADTIFIMVMNGDHVNAVVADIKDTLSPGATVFITATVGPWYVQEAAEVLQANGARVMDMPVSGGRFGANDGTLSLMVGGDAAVLEEHREMLEAMAVKEKVYHVGPNLGDGQTVKSCIQAYQGTAYEALFEAMVMAEKAGLDLEQFALVLNESIIGSAITRNTTRKIIDRQFVDTGSHISTITKDISISLELAKRLGVPMYTAVVAREMFQAGINMMPEGDNWSVVKILEQQAGIKRDD